MIVYADDISYAKKIFPGLRSWKNKSSDNLSRFERSFVTKIIKVNNFFTSDLTIISNWQYTFLSKVSQQSQFDLLYRLNKEEPNLPDGIICQADSGLNFHGYRNREWKTQSGNLHLSIFKKPGKPVPNFHVGFTIMAAVSVIQTLDMIPEVKDKTGIKWVNDILIDNYKISGVITQTQSQNDVVTAVVLGIGLNIEQAPRIRADSFVQKSTCLYEHVSKNNKNGISKIFKILIDKLSTNYDTLLNGNYDSLLSLYKERSLIFGREVEIYVDPNEGKNSLIAKGKVIDIGNDLELYIKGFRDPIRNGRLVLLK